MPDSLSSLERGDRSETVVETALREILETTNIIVSFFRTKRYSVEDLRGKDFILRTLAGEEIPLQVKSSFRAAQRFLRKARMHHRNITPVIVVTESDTSQSILCSLIQVIKQAIAQFRTKLQKIKASKKRKPRYGRICHSPMFS